MANRDIPSGLKPNGEIKSQNTYVAAGVIGIGDAVAQEAGGRVEAPAGGAGSVYSAALCGVALTAASGAGVNVVIADDPNQEFVVQADGADIDAQTDFGMNYALIATAASSGESRQELDSDSSTTGATHPLKALRLGGQIGDSALGANAKVVVKINNHQKSTGTGTAGV